MRIFGGAKLNKVLKPLSLAVERGVLKVFSKMLRKEIRFKLSSLEQMLQRQPAQSENMTISN